MQLPFIVHRPIDTGCAPIRSHAYSSCNDAVIYRKQSIHEAWTSHPVAVHVTENHNPKENEHQTRIDRPSQRCTKPSGGRGTGGAHQSRERQEKKKTAETGAPCRSQRRQWNFLNLLDARRSSEYIYAPGNPRPRNAPLLSLATAG